MTRVGVPFARHRTPPSARAGIPRFRAPTPPPPPPPPPPPSRKAAATRMAGRTQNRRRRQHPPAAAHSGRARAAVDGHCRAGAVDGAVDENRRESFMLTLTSSDERTKLFETRLDHLKAFLDHDPGEPGHGGAARAATTSGLPAETVHAVGDWSCEFRRHLRLRKF